MKIFRLTKVKIIVIVVIIIVTALCHKLNYNFKIDLYCDGMNKKEVCENYKKESELKYVTSNSILYGLPIAFISYILISFIQNRKKGYKSKMEVL